MVKFLMKLGSLVLFGWVCTWRVNIDTYPCGLAGVLVSGAVVLNLCLWPWWDVIEAEKKEAARRQAIRYRRR